jgi:pyrroloquinoline quinone biosynthesis protein D
MPSTGPMQTGSDAGCADLASQPGPTSRPRLAPHVRLTFDPARERHVLLAPEAVTVLNATGAAILGLCDGQRTVTEIAAELHRRYDRVDDDEVRLFLAGLAAKGCLEAGHG